MPSYKLDIIVNAKDNASRVLGGLGRTLGGLGKVAGIGLGLATAAVAGAGIAAIKITKDAISVATEYESALAILNIAAKGYGLTLDELSAATLKVGGDTRLVGVDAMQTADAVTNLFKAGLKPEEIFGDLQGYMAGTTELAGALRASIDLAAASELDMDRASEIAAITLATFGGDLKTVEQRAEFVNFAMNNLLKTADASVASVSDLSAAYSTIGPTAAAFGFGLDELNTALGILSTRGIVGAEAGTALKSMLTNMMRPTTKTQAAIDALSISLYDEEGNMRSLSNIVGQLSKSMAGLTEEQRNAYIQQLAGTYGMKAMQTLIKEGPKGWIAMTDAIGGAATIQEQAAAKANTLAGAQEALAGAWQTLQITAAKELLPTLIDLTRWAAEMITKYGPAVVQVVKGIAEAFRGFIGFLSGEDEYADWFVDLVEKLPGWLQPIVGLIGQLIAGGFSFGDMLPPEALVLWESFQRLLDTLGAWWDVNGPAIMESARQLGRVLKEAFMELVERVLPWLAEKLDQFGVWWTDNGPLVVAFVDNVAKAIALMAVAVVNMWIFVKPVLDLLFEYIGNLAKLIMQVATGDWAGAWQTMQDIVSDAWNFIQTVIETAIAVLVIAIDKFVNKLFGISLPSWLGGKGNQESSGSDTGGGGSAPSAPIAPSGPMGQWARSSAGNTNTNNFNMTVNTRATSPSVQQDYRMMQARIP